MSKGKCVEKMRTFVPTRAQLNGILLGQVISILIVGTGLTSSLLADKYKVNIPTTQSFLNYFLLSFLLIPLSIMNKREREEERPETGVSSAEDGKNEKLWEIFKKRGWIYLLLAIVDVEANFLVVLAYQYTSITSVMLLDCFTIPCVMFGSYFFLKYKYRAMHIIGAGMSISGIALLMVGDVLTSDESNRPPNPLLGDCLCLIGAILYSVSNVGQEKMVCQLNYKRTEYLGFLGFFGSIVGFVQVMIIERSRLPGIDWQWQVILLMLGFAICLFCMYTLVPTMLRVSSATFLNLSLLTSDGFSIIISIYVFNQKPSIFYYFSLVLAIVGLFIYNAANNIQENSNFQFNKLLTEPISEEIPKEN